MNILSACLLLVCAALSAGACAQAGPKNEERQITLAVGRTEILRFAHVKRVAVGNGEVASVKVLEDSKQVLLIALKPGITDMRVWHNHRIDSYAIRVVAHTAAAIAERINARLQGVEGVEVVTRDDRVILEGRTFNQQDTARVAAVSKAFPNALNFVSPAQFTMQGMIRLDVKVLEINRTGLTDVGIDWDNAVNGLTFGYIRNFHTNPYFNSTLNPISPDLGNSASSFNRRGAATYAGIATRFGSVINLLVQNGLARLLAEPKLSCKSGGSAQFVVGGEVPIPVTNTDGAISVTFKEFGVILKMSPVSDRDGYVSTKVDVEVSTIDPSITVLGIPGFATRKTQTEMNVRDGETMVLAGLMSSETSKNVDKVPGVGHLPIIGELFKSRQFRNRETELVVFVTPHLVKSQSAEDQAEVQHVDQLMRTTSDQLRFNIMD